MITLSKHNKYKRTKLTQNKLTKIQTEIPKNKAKAKKKDKI